MPLINIIQEKRTELKRQETKVRWSLAGLSAVTSVGIGIFGILWLGTESLASDERSLNTERAKQEPILKTIEASQKQYNLLNPRLVTLSDAADATQRWARILDHLSRSCPQQVWLTGLRCSQNSIEEAIIMEMQGLGPDQDSVSRLILNLQSSTDLETVDLRYTQGDAIGANRAIKYEITGAIKGTAKPIPVAPAKEGEGEGEKKAGA